MPPSGFSPKAIAGLLQFLEGCYEDLQAKVEAKGGSSEAVKEAMDEELANLRSYLGSFTIAAG